MTQIMRQARMTGGYGAGNRMPTLAKLVAAVAFAVVGWLAAICYHAAMPPGAQVGRLVEMSAAAGFLCGWFVMGRLVGHGYRTAMGSGVRTSVTLAVVCLAMFDIILMLRKSVKMRYDGPMEAVIDIFDLSLQSARPMLTPTVLAVLLLGGLIGGFVTEAANRRGS